MCHSDGVRVVSLELKCASGFINRPCVFVWLNFNKEVGVVCLGNHSKEIETEFNNKKEKKYK